MATPIRTDLGSILLAVKDRLVTQNVFSPSACYLGLTPDISDPPPADQFAVIVPAPQIVDQPAVTGGGNTAMIMDGELFIWLWSRCNTDVKPRSENWLTDTTMGALGTLRDMIKSLQLWQPTNTDGDGLVFVPMKLQAIEQGKRLNDARSTLPPGWGNMVTRWKYRWWFDLT